MGVDPGLAKTGWGVVRVVGRQAEYVDSGLIRTAARGTAHIERLRAIGGELQKAAAVCKPDLICVEKVFVNVNLKSSLLLGEARGAAMFALLAAQAPIIEFTALQIKQSVVGAGRADKKQVALMVGKLLNISVDGFAADCTDALACALTAAAAPAGGSMLRRRSTRRRRSPRR